MSQLLDTEISRGLRMDIGLSMADYRVLAPLSEAPDHRLRMQDLASRAHWEKSRLSHQVRRMESRRLVRREECATDARGAFAIITPEGLQAVRKAAPLHVARVRRLLVDVLSREQLQALADVCETVVEAPAER
ncbi:MarR family transcriptional regulator [Streptomyces lucensis JCM 4490]|uniref:MarR family transcriptional regulator n=1 Tax=Streptomyces lucensis JCM 4490 TaxID=1306176 RepID=A0A918J7Z9_9ACTN|nr:MarR family transcriptional regulator [Streptomyces lucensis]GGW58514.1 MarR family transcriptional regulator [Streptomyces lucensis JCM 4490]